LTSASSAPGLRGVLGDELASPIHHREECAIVAAHIEHGVTGAVARADYAVARFAKRHPAPCGVVSADPGAVPQRLRQGQHGGRDLVGRIRGRRLRNGGNGHCQNYK
jgi:hypothetical protein